MSGDCVCSFLSNLTEIKVISLLQEQYLATPSCRRDATRMQCSEQISGSHLKTALGLRFPARFKYYFFGFEAPKYLAEELLT